jgi:hypothetical protein
MDWSTITFLFPFILILVVCGIQLLRGKWLMIIAGYNTATKEEREKINGKALGKFLGSVLIINAILLLFLTLFISPIVTPLIIILMTALVIGSIIYASVSKKFKNNF